MKLIKVIFLLSLAIEVSSQECTLYDSSITLSDTVKSGFLENMINVEDDGLIAYQSYQDGENYRCEVERLNFDFTLKWKYEKTSTNKLELYHVVENTDNTLLLIFKSTDSIFTQQLSVDGDLITENDITSAIGRVIPIHNIIREDNHWTLLGNLQNDILIKIDDQGRVLETKVLDAYFESTEEPDPQDPFVFPATSESKKIIDYNQDYYLLIGRSDISPTAFDLGVIPHIVKIKKSTYEIEHVNFLDQFNVDTDRYNFNIIDLLVHSDKSISAIFYRSFKGFDGGPPVAHYAKLDAQFNLETYKYIYTANVHGLYQTKSEDVLIYMNNALYKVDEMGYLYWGSDYIGYPGWQRILHFNQVIDSSGNLYFNVNTYQDSTYFNRKVRVGETNGCVNFMSGYVHHDENQDCLRQSMEYGIQGMRIKDDFDYDDDIIYFSGNPNRYVTSDNNGYYQFPLVRDTGNFTILHRWSSNQMLQFSCVDSIFYDVRDSVNYHLANSNFSVWADSLCSDFDLTSARASRRICSSGQIKLFFHNRGLLTEYDQSIKIKTDGKLIIDTITTNIDTIISGEYYFSPVHRDISVGRSIQFSIPDSVSCDAQLNDVACIYTELELERPCDPLNSILYDTICVVLTNSYDPNDIVGLVDGEHACYDPNSTTQNITYTVRFQNTGNDTAYNVTILDTLGTQFDVKSLKFLYKSHNYEYQLLEDSILRIAFNDINLLDTSWYLSPEMTEGFIQFQLDGNFEKHELIENRVGIYFDANDPIITNTSSISICDKDADGFAANVDCDDSNPLVFPGQIEVPYNGIDDDCDLETLDDDLDQDGFLLADDCDDDNSDIHPGATEIPNNGVDEDCDGVDLISSIHELTNGKVNIYPNPVIDKINIDVEGKLRFELRLYDLKGKLIINATNIFQIGVDNLPSGIYLLEIRDLNSSQKIVERIVIGR